MKNVIWLNLVLDTNITKSFEGEIDIGSQYHYYMETQSVVVKPIENGEFDVFASTQFMWVVNDALARILKLPHNKFNIYVSSNNSGGFYLHLTY